MSNLEGGREGTGATEIADLAGQVRADLQVWATRWPIFAPVRFSAIAQTTAVHLPALSRSARALAALVSLWIIAFDEVVDEDRLTSTQLTALTERCRRLVARPEAPDTVGADPLCASLQEIVRQMTERSTFAAFASTWQGALTDMLDAIIEHRRLGNPTLLGTAPAATSPAVPSFAAMLALTTRSIGVCFYLISSWVLYEEPDLILRREALLRSAEACAQAIRLANDLQTWRRDAEEGSVNTLTALEWELAQTVPDLPADDRRRHALATLQEHLVATMARTRTELHNSAVPTSPVERDMEGLASFVTQLYVRYDFHTYPATPSAPPPVQCSAETAPDAPGTSPCGSERAGTHVLQGQSLGKQ
ncbi:MAG TPA: terpene synthase family protein [Chloroflexota bacterium]|jgi:hypothetical protein